MNIAIVFGLGAGYDGNGLRALGLRFPTDRVTYHAWNDPLPPDLDVAIGHSYGGWSVLKYADTYPNCKIVVLDPVPAHWLFMWGRLKTIPTRAVWAHAILRKNWGKLFFPSQKIQVPFNGFDSHNEVLTTDDSHSGMCSSPEIHNKIVQLLL